VTVAKTTAGPVVLARVAGGRRNSGVAVLYGHLDVKAPGPGWTSRPFQPVRRQNKLVARGASDDKGQLMAHIVALESWRNSGGPPGDVIVVVDGSEEVGSPRLRSVLFDQRNRGLLTRDVSGVVISDTRTMSAGVPSLTVSQRGVLSLSVVLSSGSRAVHAGRYGGAVIDPTIELGAAVQRLARALSRLKSPLLAEHPTDAEVRAGAAGLARHADRLAERVTRRGAVTVTSFTSGTAPGAIPHQAEAALDVRLPPDSDPETVKRMIAETLRGKIAPGIRLSLKWVSSGRGMVLRQPQIVRRAIDDACRSTFGAAPVAVASGGSIPAVRALSEFFNRPPILLGLGPPDDGAHGPDEHIEIADWTTGIEMSVCLLSSLATVHASEIPIQRGVPVLSSTNATVGRLRV
jgi:acetylornithine deacetylase/succinyl-diaminopimelate desuccinylase-like protein